MYVLFTLSMEDCQNPCRSAAVNVGTFVQVTAEINPCCFKAALKNITILKNIIIIIYTCKLVLYSTSLAAFHFLLTAAELGLTFLDSHVL